MASKRVVSDGVEFAADGQVKLVVDGVTHTLRRPKIGELRRFFAGIDDIAKLEKEAGKLSVLGDSAEALVEWWGDVVVVLCDDDLPLPADVDDLPVWLLSADLVTRTMNHWREVPYLSGG